KDIPVKTELSKDGAIEIRINHQLFKIKPLTKNDKQVFHDNFSKIALFIDDLFHKNIDISRGKIQSIDIKVVSRNQILIKYVQEDELNHIFEEKVIKVRDYVIPNLFGIELMKTKG